MQIMYVIKLPEDDNFQLCLAMETSHLSTPNCIETPLKKE